MESNIYKELAQLMLKDPYVPEFTIKSSFRDLYVNVGGIVDIRFHKHGVQEVKFTRGLTKSDIKYLSKIEEVIQIVEKHIE